MILRLPFFTVLVASLTWMGTNHAADPPVAVKTGDDMETPICTNDNQCTIGGICRQDNSGNKRCMCSATCYMTVPLVCSQKNPISCMTMGENYVKKYNTSLPFCYHTRCVCPPQYDPLPVKEKTSGFSHMPPMKCDKRELKLMLTISPADSVYRGTEATIFCCINQDPRDFVAQDNVVFVQNGTRTRDPTSTPYDLFTATEDTLFTVPTCWSLTISNVQLSDSGTYMCIAEPKGNFPAVNESINFTVKTPRMIQNVTIVPSSTVATMMWDIQEGPMLKIGIKLFKRLTGAHQIMKIESAKSPTLLANLEPATPYTVFITVQDGQAEPFELTEQFQSLHGKSDPPQPEDVRLTNTNEGLQCEVEWRPPHVTNGQISKYYVQLKGELRWRSDDTAEADVDYPPGLESCHNYDGTDESKGVGANVSFFACKFGPLKPNRIYTATIWAENNAGKSEPVVFAETCSLDYAEPDVIDPPESSLTPNSTSFALSFSKQPRDTNGPIACYYLAIVPLPSNASVQKLPKTSEIVMDSFDAAMKNNINSKGDRYFAYIAESYLNYPKETIVGDNKPPSDVDPCNTLFMSRYKAQDPALHSDLKYTGFLIVRVDRDSKLHAPRNDRPRRTKINSGEPYYSAKEAGPRYSRQLFSSGPAYGYSNFFKPVYLESGVNGSTSALQVFGFVFLALFTLIILAGFLLYLLYKKGLIRHLCPIKKDHNLLRQAFQPIPVSELAAEFIIRHRDSDFLFTSEFDALPKPSLPCTVCDKKENERKNRYHDIKACDETRVKLKNPGPDGSDYINANFIKGYDGKKTFIAAQAPLDTTMEDFWKMIWEQDVSIVIMVANINERGRKQATKYWPNQGEDNMLVNGELDITCIKTDQYADYSKREFELVFASQSERQALARSSSFRSQVENDYANVPVRPSSKNSNKAPLLDGEFLHKEIRKVHHYHFTNWVDLKAPESTCGILRLMLRLRKTDDYLNHPVLIHCSAGVGRTGTFIAIDTLMDQCVAEGKADVFGTVASIRQQRNSVMVQTMEQYAFIYRAVAEHFLFGDTDVHMDDFCHNYAKLKHTPRERRISCNNAVRMSSIQVSFDQNNGEPPQTVTGVPASTAASTLNAKLKSWKNGAPKDGNLRQSGLEQEYQLLFTNIDPMRSVSMGQKEENARKNRFPNIIPFDRYRVILSPRIGCSSSTQYINATSHRGYLQFYILAQDPVDYETAYDFWRMVDDSKSTTLVMLSKEEEFSHDEKYWPEQTGNPLIFGKDSDLLVSLISERIHPTFMERKIHYRFKREEETCEVIQYSFLGWTTGCPTPATPGPLRELVLKVLTRQCKFTDPGPVIVHSRDGSSEPAIFVAIATAIERLGAEKMVDVFRTCRSIFQHRPHVFTQIEQYTFVYDTIAEYIQIM